jgi:alkanesulfonate monooxygenase SsuD/methylene tetrahydromethanopterin reductase-like flavin-dependent oxidoreductase (luciferase family)
MRFGISFPPYGPYADPRSLAELAREAENSGWNGCFLWDHIQFGSNQEVGDPWIALTAIALATERLRIGTLVTPLYRRIPAKVARETVSLDRLSGGRLILGIGLGSDLFGEIATFAGPAEDRVRARMLDENLAILTGLWRGERFSFSGEYFRVKDALFLPTPIQKPRIPIWVAGTWPKRPPFRRAARYDGVVPVTGDMSSQLSVDQIQQLTAHICDLRGGSSSPYDIVYSAAARFPNEISIRKTVSSYAAAGATWWLETMMPSQWPPERARERIHLGPPI